MMRRTPLCFVAALVLVGGSTTVFATGQSEDAASDGPIPVELLEPGWTNVPNDPGNPYETWINETYNIDFTLTNTSEFESLVLIRFASDDPPDIVVFGGNKTLMETAYEQGVLVSDWNQYLDQIPTIDDRYPDAARTLFNRDGNLITLARHEEISIWSLKLRRDWMTNLGLTQPTTPDELLEVAREFTFNDPDGNGDDDTYAFTSSGGGQSLGEIENLLAMYGPMSFHVADGEVSHPILNGDQKKFYDFMRQVVSEGLIEPDWYTQGWAERKPALFSGALGVAWYPGVLVNEVEGGTGNTGETIDWWDSLPMPKGDSDGGKQPEAGVHGILLSVSQNAESNSEKMDRILALMEGTTYPNDGFWKIRWGIGIDDFEAVGSHPAGHARADRVFEGGHVAQGGIGTRAERRRA